MGASTRCPSGHGVLQGVVSLVGHTAEELQEASGKPGFAGQGKGQRRWHVAQGTLFWTPGCLGSHFRLLGVACMVKVGSLGVGVNSRCQGHHRVRDAQSAGGT